MATTRSSELRALRTENQQLKAENRRLKSAAVSLSGGWRSRQRWKSILSLLCASLAVATLVVGNLLFWAGNTLINTDRYIATVTPIIKDPTVQSAVAAYTTQQLFQQIDVEAVTQQVLPPRAEFLAPALQVQIHKYTEDVLRKALASPKLQDAWVKAQTRSHDRLIKFATSYRGDGTININDFYGQLSNSLKDTKLAFLANKQLPDKVGSIQVIDAPWLSKAHTVVTHIGLWQTLATLATIAFSALAVWLSSKRRRTAIVLGWMFAGGMLVTLVALRVIRSSLAASVDEPYQKAVSQATKLVFHPLVVQTVTILLVALLLMTVAWLSGSSKGARLFKSRLEDILSGRIHESIFGSTENAFTRWVGRHKRRLQWLTVLLVAVLMLLVQLSPLAVLGYAVLLALLIASLEVLGASNS